MRNFTADVTGTCTGEMLVQHMAGSGVERDVAVTTPAFCDVNLRLAYGSGVRNIRRTGGTVLSSLQYSGST